MAPQPTLKKGRRTCWRKTKRSALEVGPRALKNCPRNNKGRGEGSPLRLKNSPHNDVNDVGPHSVPRKLESSDRTTFRRAWLGSINMTGSQLPLLWMETSHHAQ